jgi:hypothetical protein
VAVCVKRHGGRWPVYKDCSSNNEMCVRQSWILYQKLYKVRIISFINSVNIYSCDRF